MFNILSINAYFHELFLFLENHTKYWDILMYDVPTYTVILNETLHNNLSCNYILNGHNI